MRKSIFRQLLFYTLIFGALAAIISYIVIGVYFDDYYYRQQEKMLKQTTEELVHAYNTNAENIQSLLSTYASEYGITVQLYSGGNKFICGSTSQGGMHGMHEVLDQKNVGNFFIITGSGGQRSGSATWLAYLLQAEDGSLMLSRISYANMNAIIHVVEQFFLIFGIAIAAAFLLFAFIVSRSMSRPLRDLNAIATQMGKLDFSLRYSGNRKDEIGQLGQTLNGLTTKLENTITQLSGELSKERTLEKMRTQFTAQVSHELQTPLSVIKGYTEALSDNLYQGEEASDAYAILLNETEKISNMVNDLLDLSQMEAGAYVIRKENFDLRKLVERIYKRYKSLPQEKTFTLHMGMDYPEDTFFFGDPLRLEQAIRNVLVNAIKYVRADGDIRLGLHRLDGQTHITIENQGKPIDPEDLPHIFDSYYQGKSKKRGSGLGLAITRHIMSLHNGHITVSNTDDGVLFDMILS